MQHDGQRYLSGGALRAELSGRGLERGPAQPHEVGWAATPAVVYAADAEGGHGNFLRSSYRRILAHPDWARRLGKTYTASARLPRAGDRWRGELECASSSDALLMNVFCYPGVLKRPAVCALLGIDRGLRPCFGVRADLPMGNGEIDRTELDMTVGATLVEAKLTETSFGRASRDRLLRYQGVENIFDLAELRAANGVFVGYQLVRGLLAAVLRDGCFVVLLDGRRADLREQYFAVLRAVRSAAQRERMRLRTWQELAGALPPMLQAFLAVKYGIDGSALSCPG